MEQVEIVEKLVKTSEASDRRWSASAAERAETRGVSIAGFVFDLGKNFWAWLHLLSLDAPLVGVLWQLLFAKALRVHLAPVVSLVTALVIWLIYVADRILDSCQPEQGTEEALRHRFYRRHRIAFLPAFLTVFLVTGWMACADLGFKTWCSGLLLTAIVGGYFAVVHLLEGQTQRWFPKEIAVAILFGLGTFMPVDMQVQQLHLRFLLPFLLFLLVLWMNTLFIEYSEWVRLRRRAADRPHGSTVVMGQHSAAFGFAVSALALGAIVSGWFPLARPILLAEGLSALGLGMLAWQWRRISSYTVRITADLVLLTPLLLLLFLGR